MSEFFEASFLFLSLLPTPLNLRVDDEATHFFFFFGYIP